MSVSRILSLTMITLFLFTASVSGGDDGSNLLHDIDISENNGLYNCKISVTGAGIKTGYLIEKFPAAVTLVSSSLPGESISADENSVYIALTGEDSFEFTVGMQEEPAGEVNVEWKDLVDGNSGTFSYGIDESGVATFTDSGESSSEESPAGSTTSRSSPGFGAFAAVLSFVITAAVLISRRGCR